MMCGDVKEVVLLIGHEVPKILGAAEATRLDSLLSAARQFHHFSLITAGISLAVASLDEVEGFSLPWGHIILPNTQTAVGLYMLTLILLLMSDRLFQMAEPWLELDDRRPPFAWMALGRGPYFRANVKTWQVVPVVTCAVATSMTLEAADWSGFGLSLAGVFVVFLPRTMLDYWNLICKRMDHRGGQATLSIYVLYMYRIVRQGILAVFLVIPVLVAVPKWRSAMLSLEIKLAFVIALGLVVRVICLLPLVYRRIDRTGPRFGFPKHSDHYR